MLVISFLFWALLLLVAFLVVRIGWFSAVYFLLYPKGVPRSSCTFAALFDLWGNMDKVWEKMRTKDGTFYKLQNWGPFVGGKPYVVVADREAIKQILSTQDFPKLPDTYEDALSYFLGKGLATSSGEEWFAQRKMITPFLHFHSLETFFPKMVDCARKFVGTLQDSKGWLPGKDLFSIYTLGIINELAFGDRFNSVETAKTFKRLNLAFNYWFVGYSLFGVAWNYVPYFDWASGIIRIRSDFEKVIIDVVKQIRADPNSKPTELLSFLALAADEDGRKMSLKLIVDQCVTFLFAGHDTSASTLSWAMYYMSQNPETQKKTQEEVDTILGDRVPTKDDLASLKYCNNIVKETLRLQPAVALIDRVTSKDCELAGYHLAKGTPLGVGIYALHRDPFLWNDPDSFIPDRWDEASAKQPFNWIPFSAGQRNCIGSKFATQEMVLTIAMISQKFDVQMNMDKQVSPCWEGVITPVGLELKFTPRQRPHL